MLPSKPRVLLTRAPHQSSHLADMLRALGMEPLLIPAIEIVDPSSFTAVDAALAQLDMYQWLIFTSANAVEAFAQRLESWQTSASFQSAVFHTAKAPRPSGEASGDKPRSPALRLAAIGPATAHALYAHRLASSMESVLTPPQAVAESLTETLLPYAFQLDGTPTRFLLIRAEEARELLPETLRSAGAEVTVAPVYRTVVPESSIAAIREVFGNPERLPHAITFTSSSSVRNLLTLCEAAAVKLPTHARRISIGPITTRTLEEFGLPPHAEAPQATVDSLAATVLDVLKSVAVEGGRP